MKNKKEIIALMFCFLILVGCNAKPDERFLDAIDNYEVAGKESDIPMNMTREEAVANLNMISVAFVEPVTKEQRKLIDDTFDMAIEALEQEPCFDAISRQAVINSIANTNFWLSSDNWNEIMKAINAIPSINPQKWIPVSERLPEDGTYLVTVERMSGLYYHDWAIDPCNNCPYYETSGDICTLAVQGIQCKRIEVNKVVNDLLEVNNANNKRTQINDSTAAKKNSME